MKTFSNNILRKCIWVALLATASLLPATVSAQKDSGGSPVAPAVNAQNDAGVRAFQEDLLAGEWKVVKVKFAGRDLPEEDIQNMRLSVSGRTWQNEANGSSESGKFEFPETADGEPQKVDLIIEKGESAGMTLEGIIRPAATGFEVCYAVSGERPRQFESNEGGMNLLINYGRPK
jgi:uncharacterized protein (TIGR03067 family)